MARQAKPPGQEKWTWEEIRVGHKLSKGEKRYRKMAKGLGGTEEQNGNIRAPEGDAAVVFWGFFIGLFVLFIAIALLSKK